jgi:deoxyribonuclease-1-like protein
VRKLFAILAAAALAGGAWLVSDKYDIRSWDDLRLVLQSSATEDPPAPAEPPVARAAETIRIASFNLDDFTAAKAGQPHVMARLAEILARFDIVAVQEIRARNQDLLPRLVAAMNDAGRQCEYVIGPRIGRSVKEQYAYVFDTASVAVDRSEVYTVNDPHDLLHREPLVAWFRVRGPAPELHRACSVGRRFCTRRNRGGPPAPAELARWSA